MSEETVSLFAVRSTCIYMVKEGEGRFIKLCHMSI